MACIALARVAIAVAGPAAHASKISKLTNCSSAIDFAGAILIQIHATIRATRAVQISSTNAAGTRGITHLANSVLRVPIKLCGAVKYYRNTRLSTRVVVRPEITYVSG